MCSRLPREMCDSPWDVVKEATEMKEGPRAWRAGKEDEGDTGQAAEESSGALGGHSPVLSRAVTRAGAS